MRLSKNFTLNELIKSQTATRQGIDNYPNAEQLENLKVLTKGFLQPLRDVIGYPIRVTSCLRVLELDQFLNGIREKLSQHTKGEAVDFEITGFDNFELAQIIEEKMDFDQMILEYYEMDVVNSGWIHCSYKKTGNRGEVLTARRNPKTKKTWYSYGLNPDFYNTIDSRLG